MTETAQKQHPGVIALEQRIIDMKANLSYYRRAAAETGEEQQLQARIAALQEELAAARSRRQYAIDQLAMREADVQRAEHTLELARDNSKVAEVVWLKLLAERNRLLAKR